jgi:hypothetical protein
MSTVHWENGETSTMIFKGFAMEETPVDSSQKGNWRQRGLNAGINIQSLMILPHCSSIVA